MQVYQPAATEVKANSDNCKHAFYFVLNLKVLRKLD